MQDDFIQICAIMLSQVDALPPGQQADDVRAKIAVLVRKYEAGAARYINPAGIAPGDDAAVDALLAKATSNGE